MFNKATDAVSKMTIKMNESDIVSSPVPLGFPAPSGSWVRSPEGPEISEIKDFLFKIIQSLFLQMAKEQQLYAYVSSLH